MTVATCKRLALQTVIVADECQVDPIPARASPTRAVATQT
jgi:hypothetical protein